MAKRISTRRKETRSRKTKKRLAISHARRQAHAKKRGIKR